MICPRCGKLISISEQKCPFCGAWNPSLYGFGPGLQKFIGRRLDLVSVIVGACIVLYVTSLALQPSVILHPPSFFDILAPGTGALQSLGMTGGRSWAAGWWWTLLTAIYLHGSLLHIFFNVLWIRNLGPAVVDVWGPSRAFIIFSLAGALGFLLSNYMGAPLSIGASGAIFGLLASLLVYGRRVGHSALTAQLWQWALIMFVMGFVMRGVNNWAHAGGFVSGWVVSTLMRTLSERREGRAAMIFGILLAILTVAGVALSFTHTVFSSPQ